MSLPLIWFLSLHTMSLSLGPVNFPRGRSVMLGCPLGDSLAAFPWQCMPCSDAQVPGKVCALDSWCLWAGLASQHRPGILPLLPCAPHYPCVPHSSIEVKSEHRQNHQNSRKRQIFGCFKSTSDSTCSLSLRMGDRWLSPKHCFLSLSQRIIKLKGPGL